MVVRTEKSCVEPGLEAVQGKTMKKKEIKCFVLSCRKQVKDKKSIYQQEIVICAINASDHKKERTINNRYPDPSTFLSTQLVIRPKLIVA